MIKRIEEYNQYSGIIHIHSTHSDGSLPIQRIAAIANELDFDFLLFTDHNTLQPKFEKLEGWYDHILVGIGCEINDASDLNHYLAFDINEEISNELPPQEYVSLVKKQGGFGIIAHPDEKRSAMPEYPAYPWTVWETDEFDGIEIWNQMSEWMEGLTHKNKYWRVLHPRKSILGPTAETLGKWDSINMKRKVFGIGGVDAHAHVYKLWGLFHYRIFRYKVIFKTVRTHILTKEKLSSRTDHATDLQKIYRALKDANGFISNHYVGDATGFRAWVSNDQDFGIMGDTISIARNTILRAEVPQEACVRLMYNGSLVAEATGTNLQFDINHPGIYRLEIYKGERPWIYTNHFRITDNKQK